MSPSSSAGKMPRLAACGDGAGRGVRLLVLVLVGGWCWRCDGGGLLSLLLLLLMVVVVRFLGG